MNVAALGPRREDPVTTQEAQGPILDAAGPAANVLHVAANACKVLRKDDRLSTRGPNAVRVVVDERISDRRSKARAKLVAEVLSGLVGIAFRGQGPVGGRQRTDAVRINEIRVGEEGALIESDLVVDQRVAGTERDIFRDREAEAERGTRARLRVGRVAAVTDVIETVVILAEDIAAEKDLLVEQIRLDKAELDGLRIARPVHARVELLALAHEVPLGDRESENELLEARITGRKLQFPGRLFFDVDAQDDAVRRRALALLDLQVLLEESKRLEAILRTLHLQRVEGIALVDTELAADHLVAGRCVALNIDPFDIVPRRFIDAEADVHFPLLGTAIVSRVDVGERVAEVSGFRAQPGDGVFDGLGVKPVAGLKLDRLLDLLGRQVAKGAFGLDSAELVAGTFFDDVGDHEVAPVRRQLRKRGNDTEVCITLRQVKGAEFLLVGRQSIRVVAVVRLEEAEHAAGLASEHLLAKLLVTERLVADDVDAADLGLVALVDLEHEVDAVLLEVDHLRLDLSGEAALALVKLDDPLDVGPDLRPSEDFAGLELDLGKDLVVLDALVALKDDPVDDRVFLHSDDDVPGLGARDHDVREKLGRVEFLQRGIERLGRIALAGSEIGVSADRLGFETLVAAHGQRADNAGGLGRRGDGGRLGRGGRGSGRSRRRRCWSSSCRCRSR